MKIQPQVGEFWEVKVPSTDPSSSKTEKVFITERNDRGVKILSPNNWTAMGATLGNDCFIQQVPMPKIDGTPFTYLGLCVNLANDPTPSLYVIRRIHEQPIFSAIRSGPDSLMVFDCNNKKSPLQYTADAFLDKVREETATNRNPVIGTRAEMPGLPVADLLNPAEFFSKLPVEKICIEEFMGIPQPFDPFEL
jgi:hypothetical protein